MFRDVPECSGMFRHVPECSMFRVLSTALTIHNVDSFSLIRLFSYLLYCLPRKCIIKIRRPIKDELLC